MIKQNISLTKRMVYYKRLEELKKIVTIEETKASDAIKQIRKELENKQQIIATKNNFLEKVRVGATQTVLDQFLKSEKNTFYKTYLQQSSDLNQKLSEIKKNKFIHENKKNEYCNTGYNFSITDLGKNLFEKIEQQKQSITQQNTEIFELELNSLIQEHKPKDYTRMIIPE